MRPVVAGRAAVQLFLRQVLDSRTAVVISEVDSLRPRICGPEQRIAPATREQRLERIIGGGPIGNDLVDVRLQAELDEKRATVRPRPRRARVDVDETHLTDCARAHIPDLTRKLPRQLTFDEEVEGVNFLAHRRLREGRRPGVRRE